MQIKVIIELGYDQLDVSFLPKEWDVETLELTKDNYIKKIAEFPKSCVVIN